MSPEVYAVVHPLIVERQQKKAEIEAAERRVDEINNEIGALFVAHAIEKARVDRWSVSVGMGSRTFTDDRLLLDNGVAQDVINASKRTTHFPRVDVREVGAKS